MKIRRDIKISKRKIEVYVDASVKDGKAGIGLIAKRDDKIFKTLRLMVNGCNKSHEAEEIALLKGVEFIKRNGNSPKRCVIYTDYKAMAIKYNEGIDGITIKWIPRELNEAHTQSIFGRRRKSSKGF